jgi:hypothetical protein
MHRKSSALSSAILESKIRLSSFSRGLESTAKGRKKETGRQPTNERTLSSRDIVIDRVQNSASRFLKFTSVARESL